MRSRREGRGPEAAGAEVWPAYVRYPALVLLAGIGLVGLIVVVYDAGWLPLAGPFVAMVVAAVIVYVVLWWRARQLRRLGATAARQLEDLAPAIAHERGLPSPDRATGASDRSLDQAAQQAAEALKQLAWGHEQGAVPLMAGLADQARGSWHADAPLTQRVEELAGTAAELDRVVRRTLRTAARGRRSDRPGASRAAGCRAPRRRPDRRGAPVPRPQARGTRPSPARRALPPPGRTVDRRRRRRPGRRDTQRHPRPRAAGGGGPARRSRPARSGRPRSGRLVVLHVAGVRRAHELLPGAGQALRLGGSSRSRCRHGHPRSRAVPLIADASGPGVVRTRTSPAASPGSIA